MKIVINAGSNLSLDTGTILDVSDSVGADLVAKGIAHDAGTLPAVAEGKTRVVVTSGFSTVDSSPVGGSVIDIDSAFAAQLIAQGKCAAVS